MKWAVKLSCAHCNYSLDELANRVAMQMGAFNQGQIGKLHKHFLFSITCTSGASMKLLREFTQNELKTNAMVEWFEQQIVRNRSKRELDLILDPFYSIQWHLHNHRPNGLDLNITGIWQHNITGNGITVCIIDDGIDWTHPDLQANYNANGSWDLNDNDADPMPSYQDGNEHGTRCAGEIAAAANEVCGVGVAYNAKVSAVRILAGNITDAIEAVAFTQKLHVNHIYTCSWGPPDDGEALDGPHLLTQQALEYGIEFGRHGLGAIYVVASGNGRQNGDNCNFDGYATSIYTVTIGAVDEMGNLPFYAEECAAMLAVTFSGGSGTSRNILTTERRQKGRPLCTDRHSGTSAAAPLAAGVIALMLEVNPCLSWRDVQYLIILTSTKVNPAHYDWFTNSALLNHNPHFGFGLLNAWNLVNAAKIWPSVPQLTTYKSPLIAVNLQIPHLDTLIVNYTVSAEMLVAFGLYILEHVQVGVTIKHPSRGRLEIALKCASGAISVLATPRPRDKSKAGLNDWLFATVRCWGERPNGTWILMVKDTGAANLSKEINDDGLLISWYLILHGTWLTPAEFDQRQR